MRQKIVLLMFLVSVNAIADDTNPAIPELSKGAQLRIAKQIPLQYGNVVTGEVFFGMPYTEADETKSDIVLSPNNIPKQRPSCHLKLNKEAVRTAAMYGDRNPNDEVLAVIPAQIQLSVEGNITYEEAQSPVEGTSRLVMKVSGNTLVEEIICDFPYGMQPNLATFHQIFGGYLNLITDKESEQANQELTQINPEVTQAIGSLEAALNRMQQNEAHRSELVRMTERLRKILEERNESSGSQSGQQTGSGR